MKLSADTLRLIVPVLSLVLLLGGVFYLQPRAMSYMGLNLLFNLAVPIALATIAQLIIMAVNMYRTFQMANGLVASPVLAPAIDSHLPEAPR